MSLPPTLHRPNEPVESCRVNSASMALRTRSSAPVCSARCVSLASWAT